jgi:hypothetical protein
MLLNKRDARDMCKGLRDKQIGVAEHSRTGAEQTERTKDRASRAHRNGMHRCEAGVARRPCEPRPSTGFGPHVGDGNRLASGIAVHAGAFVGLKLEQFDVPGLFGGSGQKAKLTEWVREEEPSSFDVEKVCAPFRELGEQVNNVKVIEQAVDQSDHGGKDAGFTGRISHIALLGDLIRFELESAVKNVPGDIGGTAAGGIGVRAKSYQGLGRVDLELGNEHASGLTDLSAQQRVEFGPGIAGRVGDGGLEVAVEEVQKRNAGNFGGGGGAGQILAGEIARLATKKVKSSNVFAGNDHRHGVHSADLMGEHGGTESGPPDVIRVGEVNHQNRRPLSDRIEARAFSQSELELVEHAAGYVARAEGSGRRPVKDEGDGGGIDVEEDDTGRAKAVGGFASPAAIDGGEQLLVDCHH